MRRSLALILAAALALPGCLEVTSRTELKKDGSGTYTQTTTVDMAKALAYAKELKAQARGLGLPPEEADDPFEVLDAKKRAAALTTRKGITVKSSTQRDTPDKKSRTYELSVAFDSLQQMYAAGVVEDVSVKLERVRKGKAWKLTIRHVFDGTDREPLEGPAADRLRKMRESMLKRYERMWGTLAITSQLALPGAILETNGTKDKDKNLVTWRIGFLDLADARKLVQHVTFEHTKDTKLEPFELSANDIANAIEEAQLEAEEQAKKQAADAKKAKDAKK